MRRLIVPALAAAVALGTVAAGPAESRADVDHEVVLAVDESTTVDGGVPQGVNPDYHGQAGVFTDACTKDVHTYCETILVHVTNPYEEENAKKGRERATLNMVLTTGTNQLSDYDFKVFESDADGTRGDEVASAGAFPYGADSTEAASVVVTTTADSEEMWLLVEVVYFSAFEAWSMDLDFG